jgi:putative transposase
VEDYRGKIVPDWRPDFDPNHLYFVTTTVAEHRHLFKRDVMKHVADRLIRQYRAEDNQAMLGTLSSMVAYPTRQRYKVWEDGYNGKDVFSPEFLRQKLAYMHSNPCQPHWCLAELSEDYVWSSARFYLLDEPAIIPLDNAKHLLS